MPISMLTEMQTLLQLAATSAVELFRLPVEQFAITQTDGGNSSSSLDILGLQTAGIQICCCSYSGLTTTTDWVDEKAPAIKINYNENTQQLEFTVDRTVLGTGTESNFNSFSIFGSSTADSTNNLGVPTQDDASTVLIRGGEVLRTEPFVADGEEIQLNDKRYGVQLTIIVIPQALRLQWIHRRVD